MTELGLIARVGFPFLKSHASKFNAAVEKDPRHPKAYYRGGLTEDPAVISAQRKVALEIIKQIGANVVRGKDLLYVTFPAKCSEPNTVLQRFADSVSYSPDFLNKAAEMRDPVERMASVIAFYIGGLQLTSGARKPLNPVLGETYQAVIGDDTHVFLEQSSHHPPTTNYYVRGQGWKYYGSLSYSAKFGVNELRLINKGERIIQFDDGGVISFNTPSDVFSGVMCGSYRHDIAGNVLFMDKANGISCNVLFGKSKNLPLDYFHGQILRNNVEVGTMEGSWLGFVDYNGCRLWDIEDSLANRFSRSMPAKDPLPSDSRFRKDIIALENGDMASAEEGKRCLEDAQRRDRKLRAGTKVK